MREDTLIKVCEVRDALRQRIEAVERERDTERLMAKGLISGLKLDLDRANALLERCVSGERRAEWADAVRRHLTNQPAAPARTEACSSCKRDRCDCYERECDKCHWPGSPDCRRAELARREVR